MKQPSPMLTLAQVIHQMISCGIGNKICNMTKEIVRQFILQPSCQTSRIMKTILVEFQSLRLLHVAKNHHLSFRIYLFVQESCKHVNGTAACKEENVDVFGMRQDFLQEHLPYILVLRPLNSHTSMQFRDFRITQVLGI